MATFYEIMRQKNMLSPMLLRRPGIHGVGVGFVDPSKPNRGAAVIVYTHKNIVPTKIRKIIVNAIGANIPFRLISAGPFRPNSAESNKKMTRGMVAPKVRVSAEFFRSRIRPVPAGTSIGRTEGTGTAGLITIRNGQLYILSNNHVLVRANQYAADIYQPGTLDGGTTSDLIGRSVEYVPFNLTGANYMDAAIAKPLSNSLLNPRYLISAGRLITLQGYLRSYSVGTKFVKSGRTTGYVSGVVESIATDQIVGPYDELGNARLLFRNQTVVVGSGNVSLPGDSGSVWLSTDGFAAALNFAGSGSRSICTPIASVLTAFGLLVAVPAGAGSFKAGTIKGIIPKGNYAYVRPLTAAQRKQILVVRTKSKK